VCRTFAFVILFGLQSQGIGGSPYEGCRVGSLRHNLRKEEFDVMPENLKTRLDFLVIVVFHQKKTCYIRSYCNLDVYFGTIVKIQNGYRMDPKSTFHEVINPNPIDDSIFLSQCVSYDNNKDKRDRNFMTTKLLN